MHGGGGFTCGLCAVRRSVRMCAFSWTAGVHSGSDVIQVPIGGNICLNNLFYLILTTSQRDEHFCMTTMQISK